MAFSVAKDTNALDERAFQTGEMAKCPFCAELVKFEAKVCKHCSRELPEQKQPQRPMTDADIDGLVKTSFIRVRNIDDDPDSLTGAIWAGSFSKVLTLIESGADVNQPNEAGHSPLDIARSRADRPLIKILLAHGAKISN